MIRIPIPVPNKSNRNEVRFSRTAQAKLGDLTRRGRKVLGQPAGGRHWWVAPSAEVRHAETLMAMYIKRMFAPVGKEPVKIAIRLYGKLDVDGVKVILDAAEESGVIENDRQVKELVVTKGKGKNEGFDFWLERIATPDGDEKA